MIRMTIEFRRTVFRIIKKREWVWTLVSAAGGGGEREREGISRIGR